MLMTAFSTDLQEASLDQHPHPGGVVGGDIVGGPQQQSQLCVEQQGQEGSVEGGGRAGQAWENVHQKLLI